MTRVPKLFAVVQSLELLWSGAANKESFDVFCVDPRLLSIAIRTECDGFWGGVVVNAGAFEVSCNVASKICLAH